ncbi:MAG: hypothetical protein WD872_11215 [Pirellulaceae bacterium]
MTHWVSPLVIAGLVLLAVAILAHVAGNSLGTRLRDLGDRPDVEQEFVPPHGNDRFGVRAGDCAPATRLSERRTLGWPIVVATLGGTLGGGFAGGVWTHLASQGTVGPTNVAVGVVAFAILAGMASFAAFGFVQVGLGALRQAQSPKAAEPGPATPHQELAPEEFH